jgi:hypothetical protein
MSYLKFFDILGVGDAAEAAAIWPGSRVRPATGELLNVDLNDFQNFMDYLQNSLEFRSVRPGAFSDRVGLSAEVIIKNSGKSIYPFVLSQMPDVAFYLQDTVADKPARVYVTQADTGIELIIEGLPVEIKLPSGLIGIKTGPGEEQYGPKYGGEVTLTDKFSPGEFDSLQVTLREPGPSSIFVHIKVRMTEEMDFIIEPAVPISIGPCRFIGLPCRGLHDFNLVPSPRLQGEHSEGEQALEWIRHPIDRLALDAKHTGVLTIRTVDFDTDFSPLKELVEWMNAERSNKDVVEFVLEDIALPFAGLIPLPIPSHGLFGLRRKIEFGQSPDESYKFSGAPVKIKLGDEWRLLIDEFLIRSPAKFSPPPPDQFIFVQMAFVRGDDDQKTHAGTIGLTDEWTLQIGWRFPPKEIMTIADNTIKLWGVKAGISIGRAIDNSHEYGFLDMVQLLLDLSLSSKATSTTIKNFTFKMRNLSGKELDIAWRDLGWNLGEWSWGNLSFPEGVQFIFADRVRLIVEEMGWITENNGGRYFSLSGGVSIFSNGGNANRNPSTGAGSAAISEEKGNGGGIRFHRLRFRRGGDPNARSWLLDGVTLSLRFTRFEITGFGMVSEFIESGHEYKEFAFGINVKVDALAKQIEAGMQFFYGRVTGSNDNFTYGLIGLQYSPIPIGTFELVNIRLLVTWNYTPKLKSIDDLDQNMRLFRWYKENDDSIIVPVACSNRKLQKWIRRDESLAAGLGCGLSLPISKIIVLDAFLFFHKSPEESGMLIALEAKILDKTAGYGAFEYDFDKDKWGLMLGVSLGLDTIVPESLGFLCDVVSLTGNLYAGNKPSTFALGQINDQSTWLSITLDIQAWIDIEVFFALCLHFVDSPEGPQGMGFIIRVMGGASFGIGKLQIYFTFGMIAGVWRNESNAGGFIVWIEAGIRIKVFWIFTFGISAKIQFDQLGPDPDFTKLSCEICIETPWWIPDISWHFEKVWNEPQPQKLEAISAPLASSGALNPGTRSQENVAVTALEGKDIWSMDELRAQGKLSFSQDDIDKSIPIGVDSEISLNLNMPLDNKTAVGENTPIDVPSWPQLYIPGEVPAGAGTQRPKEPAKNDLSTTYELNAISINRRYRFGGSWRPFLAQEETRLESTEDLPKGYDIKAQFKPTISSLSIIWDRDLLAEGRLDPRRLLINASTPYSFLTCAPENDEIIARSDPGWPCCQAIEELFTQSPHSLDFDGTPLGKRVASCQIFPNTNSKLHWIGSKPPIVAIYSKSLVGHAARVHFPIADRVIAVVNFDQLAYIFEINIDWNAVLYNCTLIIDAYRGLELVDTKAFSLGGPSPQYRIQLKAERGMTNVTMRYNSDFFAKFLTKFDDVLEIIDMRYWNLQEMLDKNAQLERCKAQNERLKLEGGGKFAWLPNHEYEIALTTKVILKHEGTSEQVAYITQKAFFKTKGLLGLNAVARTGDELEPYIESRYPGPTPTTVYRSEPVAIVFNEKFNILSPLDRTPSPDRPAEFNQLLEWVIVIEKLEMSGGLGRISQTSTDWVAAHRSLKSIKEDQKVIHPGILQTVIREAVTLDPFQMRLERMIHSPSGCNTPELSLHRSQVLLHMPSDPKSVGQKRNLWALNSTFKANLRSKGGPLVECNPFNDIDYSAFEVANEGSLSSSPWSSEKGIMHVKGSPIDNIRHYAVFGDADWNHVQIYTSVDPENGIAGVAIGVVGVPNIARAMMVLVDKKSAKLRIIEHRYGNDKEIISKDLPTGAKPPYVLEVIAFDDKLRAHLGETALEADRNDILEGQLALIAKNGGAFNSLIVEPLDAYTFYFQSSRFIDFKEHISSFSGEVAKIPAEMLSLNESEISPQIDGMIASIPSVMNIEADLEKRQRIFDDLVKDLKLPLSCNIDRLKLSELISSRGPELILLESPEPLPFSKDVKMILKKRTLIPIVKTSSARATGEFLEIAMQLRFSDERVIFSNIPKFYRDRIGRSRFLVRSIEVEGNLQHHIYEMKLEIDRSGQYQLFGKRIEIIYPYALEAKERTLYTKIISEMRSKEIAFVAESGDLSIPIIPEFKEEFEPISSLVLTNGDETTALIIPIDQTTKKQVSLEGDTYLFEFKIDRIRFRSQKQDNVSNYREESSFTAKL